ncbi:MAG: alpha/beta fold hydrolase [Azospirillaceae bacterium]
MDLATTTYGDDRSGPPLLVLHGLFGSARNWTSLARRFAEQRPVVTADLRNHGASPWDAAMDYAVMARDLAALIDGSGGGPVDVLGHSMGGKAAMRLALDRPEAVRRLIVLDIAPVAYTDRHSTIVAAMRAIPLASLSRRQEADGWLTEAVPEPPLRQFLLQNLTSGEDGLAWRINLEAIAAHMADLTGWPDPPPGAAWRGPALFLRGGASDYVRDAHEEAIHALFPDAEIETVPGAGHWVHAEKPDAVREAVDRFLT